MLNLIKYGFYGVVFFMLMMAISGFPDIFGPEVELSETYKEKTVIHSQIYNPNCYKKNSDNKD